ncbi:MAG: alpha-hydroxy acid oxidase [Bacteroidia bacterium]|nr:alpha-hydroxy acid oxidase [Bacteroidia bacterium]
MNIDLLKNVYGFQKAAQKILGKESFEYLDSGADDGLTYQRNMDIFKQLQIKPRRLMDVSKIDMSVKFFGKAYRTPIMLAPVGLQDRFHPEAELATARAAKKSGHLMIASTVSKSSITEIGQVFDGEQKPWFQLYPTDDLEFREKLIKRAEAAGCTALVLTIDVPVLGNREYHGQKLQTAIDKGSQGMGNLSTMPEGVSFLDPAMAWRSIPWLKVRTKMRIFLKGIMCKEDARLAIEHGVDGIIVSNHGGRQLESNLSTMEVLEEVVEIVNGRIPILLDGGIRRGTDIFKALALGAKAVCLGRPYIYGLSVAGEEGVSRVLEILESELKRNMQLAGVRSLEELTPAAVKWI